MSSIKDFELAQRIHIATVQLQGRIAELEAENARLANDYNVARDAQDRRARELAKVRAENSGLVQTVRDAADYLRRAEARVKELEAESARLLALHKSTMGDADARLERAEARVKELEAENARLKDSLWGNDQWNGSRVPHGWRCNACGRVNSPEVRHCSCSGNKTLRERVSTP